MKTITLDQTSAMDRIERILDALAHPHPEDADWTYDAVKNATEELKTMFLEAEKIGAMNEYPHGKTAPNDLGGLKSVLVRRGDRLVLDFGKTLQWISMTKDEAMVFGNGLIRMAQRM